jgi:hypothetical protein
MQLEHGQASSPDEVRSQAAARRLEAVRSAWSARLGQEPALSSTPWSEGDTPVGRVLILQDVRPNTDPALVRGLSAELEGRGLQVIGAPEDGIGDEEDILFAAAARKSLGLAQLGDPEVLPGLEQFLAEHPSLDALIWVVAGEDQGSLEYRIVRRREREDVAAPAMFSVASE